MECECECGVQPKRHSVAAAKPLCGDVALRNETVAEAKTSQGKDEMMEYML